MLIIKIVSEETEYFRRANVYIAILQRRPPHGSNLLINYAIDSENQSVQMQGEHRRGNFHRRNLDVIMKSD